MSFLLLSTLFSATFFCFFSLVAYSVKTKKRSHAFFSLRCSLCYLEGYFCTFLILSIRLLGCLSNTHELLRALLKKLISSSGKVL